MMFKNQNEDKDIGYAFDAFVCYHNSDFWWLKNKLLPTLGNGEIEASMNNSYWTDIRNECSGDINGFNKFRFCVDNWHFIVGACIVDNIAEAIMSSRSIILFVTKKFIRSYWCQFEVNLAHVHCLSHRRQKIIAVVHPEILPLRHESIPVTLDALLDTMTYIEWPLDVDHRPLFWLRLSTALGTPIKSNLEAETGVSI